MANKFLDLQNGFYNALSQGLGFSKNDPFQVVQPSPPLASGVNADKLLWNYFNNIPPFSLTQNYISSGGNQFFANYKGMLSSLEGAPNTFEQTVGKEVYNQWNAYVATIPITTPINQFPMIFRNWAIRNGHYSVSNTGASALAAALLDPITNAQTGILMYSGEYPNWDAGFNTMSQQLKNAPSRSFKVNSKNMDSNVDSSWSKGNNSGFFGLWGGSSYESHISQKFASSEVTVYASFDHVLLFSATPGQWYNSSAMGIAYNKQGTPPWRPEGSTDWDTTFSPDKGNMTRFASNLVIASGMAIQVESAAQFTSDEQEEIRNNTKNGLWPFYVSGSSSGSTKTETTFVDGKMTVKIASEPGIPIVIGLEVIPVDQFVGHAIEGARMYAETQLELV